MKRLMKSSQEKLLFGVCGGIAEFFGISPLIIRLIFIFTMPASFWVYIFLYFGMPEKSTF